MRQANRRAEADVPNGTGECTSLAHNAARVGIVSFKIGTYVMLHAETVAHLVRRDIPIVWWRERHLASAVGAAVNPERRPTGSPPICTSRSPVLRPVVGEH